MKRLSDSTIKAAFAARGAGYSLAEIGVMIGISRQFVLKILQRQAYMHVSIEDSLLRLSDSLIPEMKSVRGSRNKRIVELHQDGHTGVEIAKITECAESTVCRVLKKYYLPER